MKGAARLLAPLQRRMQLMVARAIVAAVDDEALAQAVQIDLLADETQDGVERFQNYGFTSHPLPGAEAAVVFAGGQRGHGLVVAVEDRRYRMKGLAQGEVAIFDDQGQSVLLGRDGIVVRGQAIHVIADSVSIEADTIALGTGGTAVARIGDSVDPATNKIITGSQKVTAA